MQTANLGERPMGCPRSSGPRLKRNSLDLLKYTTTVAFAEPRTFWLTTLNADGSPHVTSVGPLWQGV